MATSFIRQHCSEKKFFFFFCVERKRSVSQYHSALTIKFDGRGFFLCTAAITTNNKNGKTEPLKKKLGAVAHGMCSSSLRATKQEMMPKNNISLGGDHRANQ